MRKHFSAYVMMEELPVASWLTGLWNGQIQEGNPFGALLHPHDLRGEAASWGGPHITVLDAMVVESPTRFVKAVKEICAQCEPPKIASTEYAKLGPALVARCQSPELAAIRHRLVEGTRHTLHRAPLTDEEFQRAAWRVEASAHDVEFNRATFAAAKQKYEEFGEPALPTSRHFRLNYLIGVVKRLSQANSASEREAREEGLRHFLTCGEPTWYSGAYGPHLTLASGLPPGQAIGEFPVHLWPSPNRLLEDYQPSYLAIMSEDPATEIEVRFFDALTGTFVTEARNPMLELDRAYFSR